MRKEDKQMNITNEKWQVPSKAGEIKGNIHQMSILCHTICKHYNVNRKEHDHE